MNEARYKATSGGGSALDSAAASLLDQSQLEFIRNNVPGGSDNVQEIYELSPTQEGMLFHYLLDRQRDGYVLSTLFELQSHGQLNALIHALGCVVARHDALRTLVFWEGLPRAVQVVCRQADLHVAAIDLPDDANAVEHLRERMKPGRNGLNMSRAPLAQLLHARDAGTGQWFALLQVHHIICDHGSLQRLIAEAFAFMGGRERELPEPVPYRVFLAESLANAATPPAEEFFRSTLGDITEPTAPFGLFDIHSDGSRLAETRETLDSALSLRVRAGTERLRVTPARLFHAAWALVVARTSGLDDVVFGTVVMATSQRKIAESQRTLGMSVNTLPLRMCIRNIGADELVQRTHEQLLELSKHEHTSHTLTQRCAALQGTAPLFTAVVNFRRANAVGSDKDASLGVRILERGEAWTNYPLALTIDDFGDNFLLTVQSDARVRPARIIGYVQQALHSLVDALEHRPSTPALDLEVLPSLERELVTVAFNNTHAAHPQHKLIHELFEEQVTAAPLRVAVTCGAREITYEDLNFKANQLAHVLLKRGVRPDSTVALYLERSIDAVVALLATLKAGGAYVPLDSKYPRERLRHVLMDSTPTVVVTQRRLQSALPLSGLQILSLEADADEVESQPTSSPLSAHSGLSVRHLAYIIYTSGSTGTPKGVPVEHRSVVNLLCWHHAAFGLKAGQRSSCVASLGFDAATWEILAPLTVGATLAMAPEDLTGDVEALLDWWREQDLDSGFLPTPVAEVLLRQQIPVYKLRTLLIGGDRLSFQPTTMPFAVINNYGPTESTVVATSGRIDEGDLAVHIGRPISNTQIYILNAHFKPVPMGVTGEIYVGGVGVARGYFNRPELQAQRFIADPFSDASARMYRTGDLGRWREDGTIQFLGRNDEQVKIRGYRIELGEVEAQLSRLEQVAEAVVVVRDDAIGLKRLVAYVVPKADASLDVDQLCARLQVLLPEYMVPSVFKLMARLPVTRHGKIDRRALPAPAIDDYITRQYEPPRGEIERLLAEVWQTVLGVERVGRNDNFFALGGNSLLAMQTIARIRAAMPMELPVRLLFEHSTVTRLADQLQSLRRAYLVEGIANGAAGIDDLIDEVASMPDHDVHELVRSLARREERL